MTSIKELVTKYPAERRYVLAALQDIQHQYNYIPKEAMSILSEHFVMPLSQLYSMATFYKALSLEPKGKNIIKVCDGTACHIKSSATLLQEIEKLLHIKPGETTGDGLFSLETVNCLGACAIAPVMVINESYYGKVTPTALREILIGYGGAVNGQR